MLRKVTKNSTIITTKYTGISQIQGNNPIYWRAAVTAALEARFEGGKEKTKML